MFESTISIKNGLPGRSVEKGFLEEDSSNVDARDSLRESSSPRILSHLKYVSILFRQNCRQLRGFYLLNIRQFTIIHFLTTFDLCFDILCFSSETKKPKHRWKFPRKKRGILLFCIVLNFPPLSS